MKIPRIFVYIVLSFVVTSLLFLFFGSGGLLDYRRLLGYRETMRQNIDELEQINSELLTEVKALGSDPERLRLQARELGYFREGEGVIRISGYERGKNYYTVGTVLRRKPKPPRVDWPFRAAGVAIPFLLAVVSATVRRRKNRETGDR
jgi:cell division protein FtsB